MYQPIHFYIFIQAGYTIKKFITDDYIHMYKNNRTI